MLLLAQAPQEAMRRKLPGGLPHCWFAVALLRREARLDLERTRCLREAEEQHGVIVLLRQPSQQTVQSPTFWFTVGRAL